ncbi:MAG: metallopeptidase family protein [Chloroflexi bacterium]|nr:metallopeptidase family protein [Chloroflexota bacterium]MCI0574837.1 metallopeptidase family protein [Chloroflexota bacterium]MCI0645945.1 metallopeptidase family protein [Chloroflexota bacterium]MCI0727612.1 metallopeptidase family protein [Chloroflexota bacterium]
MMLSPEQFEQLVARALDDLPVYFQQKMSNIEVLVQPWPSQRELRQAGVPPGETLLGLYNGVPLTERTHDYGLVPPDTITLYQGPIEQAAGDPAEIEALVRHVVIHEVAHHFGISDDRLWELGAY